MAKLETEKEQLNELKQATYFSRVDYADAKYVLKMYDAGELDELMETGLFVEAAGKSREQLVQEVEDTKRKYRKTVRAYQDMHSQVQRHERTLERARARRAAKKANS